MRGNNIYNAQYACDNRGRNNYYCTASFCTQGLNLPAFGRHHSECIHFSLKKPTPNSYVTGSDLPNDPEPTLNISVELMRGSYNYNTQYTCHNCGRNSYCGEAPSPP